jgi:hypothetical protein
LGLAALSGFRALLYAGALVFAVAGLPRRACSETPQALAETRVEARSANLLAVGLVHDERMMLHVSRVIDNAPLRDATVTVLLRGVVHPTIAEADGGYALETQDLRLPGPAAIVVQVVPAAGAREDLKGVLQIAGSSAKSTEPAGARQLWWWVLNFGVCIGFLMLLSRRRKAAAAREE